MLRHWLLKQDGFGTAYVALCVGTLDVANGWQSPDGQGALVTSQASLVLDLLVYIEQVEKLKTKPAFTVPTDFFVANQHDLKGLPELQFNVQDAGGDIWLRVLRLHEIAPPAPDDTLGPWLTLPKSPTKLPELKREIEIHTSKQPLNVERIEDHPEVTELFHWYVENQWQPWAAAEQPRRQAIRRSDTALRKVAPAFTDPAPSLDQRAFSWNDFVEICPRKIDEWPLTSASQRRGIISLSESASA